MKKVLFKKWIPKQVLQREGSAFQSTVPGTGCYEADFSSIGKFVTWGVDTDGDGGSYTVAIVMNEDGTIEKVLTENIRFIKEHKKEKEKLIAFRITENDATNFKWLEATMTDEEIVEYFERNYGKIFKWWRV